MLLVPDLELPLPSRLEKRLEKGGQRCEAFGAALSAFFFEEVFQKGEEPVN